MTKHEDFRNATIEVPISGTNEKLTIEKHFWDDLRKRGVKVVLMHAGRPHVSDPVDNARKHSVARLVMKCGAGFTARPKNRDDPFNLTPANLDVVKDGRAKYPALISIKPPSRKNLVDPDRIDPVLDNGDEHLIHEDQGELVVVIKDGHSLAGEIRSSRRVRERHNLDAPLPEFDPTQRDLEKLYNDIARRNGTILPTKGQTFARFSTGWFNAGKEQKS